MTQSADIGGAKPRTLDEQVIAREMSQAEIDAEFPEEEEAQTSAERIKDAVSAPEEGAPSWSVVPPDLKIPPGKKVSHLLFRGSWTEAPSKGDRTIICWSLSEMEERQAFARARGDAVRSMAELSKQMIRSIDGMKADWTGKVGSGSVSIFWSEIGTACRQMIQNLYLKTHSLSTEEQQDFFSNCFVVTNSVAG